MGLRAKAMPMALMRRREATRGLLQSLNARCVASYSLSSPSRSISIASSSGQQWSSMPFADGVSTRNFSSTSSSSAFSDLFRVQSSPRGNDRVLSLNTARNEFVEAAKNQHVPTMKRAYEIIIHAMNLDPALPAKKKKYLSEEDILYGMNSLATNQSSTSLGSGSGTEIGIGRSESLELLQRMYADLEVFFDLKPGMEHHSALAMGYCTAGRMVEALEMLEQMDPRDVDWSQLLRMAVTTRQNNRSNTRRRAQGKLTEHQHVQDIVKKIQSVGELEAGDLHMMILDLGHQLDSTIATMTPGRSAEVAAHLVQTAQVAQAKEAFTYLLHGMLLMMQEKGLRLSPAAFGDLASLWIRLGDTGKAQEIVDSRSWLESPSKDGLPLDQSQDDQLSPEQWAALCELAGSDIPRLDELSRRMVSAGQKPSDGTIVSLITGSLKARDRGQGSASASAKRKDKVQSVPAQEIIDAIDQVESTLEITCSPDIWLACLETFIVGSDPSAGLIAFDEAPPVTAAIEQMRSSALDLYRSARGRGVAITSELAQAVIQPLCSYTPVRLDDAMTVYRDWLAGPEPTIKDEVEITAVEHIFASLLLGSVHAGLAEHLETALIVVKEMQAQEVQLPPSTLDQLLPMLMRHSPGYKAAFTFYHHLLKSSSSSFSEWTFIRAITEFMSLRPVDNPNPVPCPPATYVIQIMTDMQLAGFQPHQKFYRDIIYNYGQLATESRRKFHGGAAFETQMNRITEHIKRVYTRYKLDPVIDLDCDLLNIMMDAYNRSGATAQGLGIWEDIVERRARIRPEEARRVFPPAISVVLDLLGHSGDRAASATVWEWAKKFGFATETRLWNGRVENMCRTHQFDEAQRVVFDEMRNRLDGAPAPNLQTLEIIVKFTSTWDLYRDSTVALVKEYYPEMWEKLLPMYNKRIGRSRWEEDRAAFAFRQHGGGDGSFFSPQTRERTSESY